MTGNDAYKTRYSNLSDEEVFCLFTEKNWTSLSYVARQDALQEIENRRAAIDGRMAMKLVFVELEAGEDGRCSYSTKEIFINERLLKTPKSAFGGSEMVRCVNALDTVLHEGRHAFQRFALEEKNMVPAETKWIWLLNFYNYCTDELPFAFYAFQPIERDAREFASRELIEIYHCIIDQTGQRDEKFEEGLNYLEKIKISEYYGAVQIDYEQVSERINQIRESCSEFFVTLKEEYGLSDDTIEKLIYAQVLDILNIKSGALTNFMDGLDSPDLYKELQMKIDDSHKLKEHVDKLKDGERIVVLQDSMKIKTKFG